MPMNAHNSSSHQVPSHLSVSLVKYVQITNEIRGPCQGPHDQPRFMPPRISKLLSPKYNDRKGKHQI